MSALPKMSAAEEQRFFALELARKNLIDFCRLMAPPTFIWGASQIAIADHIQRCIEGEFVKAMVNLPPRSGKSMISSVYRPAWLIGKFPDKKIMLVTGNLSLTGSFVEQLIELLKSEDFKALFPDCEVIDASVFRITYRSRSRRGERGRLTNMSVKKAAQGVGAHFLLSDDLTSEQDAQSKVILDKIWERWGSGLVTRLDPVFSRQVIVATRWSRQDPMSRMIQQDFENDTDDPWSVFKVPAIVDARIADRVNAIAKRDPIFQKELREGKVQLLENGGTSSLHPGIPGRQAQSDDARAVFGALHAGTIT